MELTRLVEPWRVNRRHLGSLREVQEIVNQEESIMATLDQKVALVTGAASGIGFAIARCYLQEGARVMMAEVDGQRLEDAARSLGCRDQLQALRADVSSAEVWQRAADQVEQTFGGLDILVNNAWIEVAGTPAHPRQSTRNSNHAPLVARTTGDGCVARTT